MGQSLERQAKGKSKGKGKKPNPYYKQKLDKGGKGKGKEGKGKKGKGKQAKGKGEAFPPQPPANKGKGKQQLPKREQWCNICWKKGHSAQTCWWNTDTNQQQHHQQEQAWYYPNHQQQWTAQQQSTAQASMQRQQPQVYSVDQQTAYTSLTPDNQPTLSLEHQSQASTQPVHSAPVYTIAMLKNFQHAYSKAAATWGIFVDTGAATSVAPKSFASDIELNPAPPHTTAYNRNRQNHQDLWFEDKCIFIAKA